MELRVVRYQTEPSRTFGLLFAEPDGPGWTRDFLCHTLEDTYRAQKLPEQTRIPQGRYRITLRTEGGKNMQYAKDFPDIHKGMLWVRDVPGFEYILIHVGNTERDTAGCLLVGTGIDTMGLLKSRAAYRRIYQRVAPVLLAGGEVWINYVDFDGQQKAAIQKETPTN